MKLIQKEIKVLGPGCAKCKRLEKSTREAVEEMGINAHIEKVEDMARIMEYNIMSTPALVVNGEVISRGRALSKKEVIKLLSA